MVDAVRGNAGTFLGWDEVVAVGDIDMYLRREMGRWIGRSDGGGCVGEA